MVGVPLLTPLPPPLLRYLGLVPIGTELNTPLTHCHYVLIKNTFLSGILKDKIQSKR